MKNLFSKILIFILFFSPLQSIFASEPQPETLVPVVIFYNDNQEIIDILPLTDELVKLNSSNIISNSTGNKEELLDYYPYGGIRLDQKAASFDEVKKFTGYEHDTDTGLEYAKTRYYHSTNGQFISQDPVFWEVGQTEDGNKVLINPQAQNSYAYTNGNPINNTDPDGRIVPLVVGGIYMAAPYIIAGLEIAATAFTAGLIAHDAGTIAGTAMSNAPSEYKNSVYTDIAGNWGAGLSVASQLAPAVAGEARTATRTTLQANKATGAAFEGEVLSGYKAVFPQTQPQITVLNESGVKTRLDMIIPKGNGNFCLIECKSSSTAPLTKNQSLAFPEIQKSGATVVGNGKPGIPGGTFIGPTKVNIVRPNK